MELSSILKSQFTCNFTETEQTVLDTIGGGFSTITLDNLQISTDNIIGNKTGKLLVPGDICCFLRPIDDVMNGHGSHMQLEKRFVLFVGHQTTETKNTADTERLLWLSLDGNNRIRLNFSCTVADIGRLKRESETSKNYKTSRKFVPRSGILSDGKKYIRHPFLMYHDDFNPSSTLYPQGSNSGCYILPLGLSPGSRSSVTSARIISLTPTGCSTVKLLSYIVPDIVLGCTKGISATDPCGNRIKIFLDPIGAVADYPASSPLLDVRSHSADAPCTACSFRNRKNQTGSEFGYSSSIHSNRLGYVRTAERSIELRKNGLTEPNGQPIGMLEGDVSLVKQVPIFQLYFGLLDKALIIPKTVHQVPVMSNKFDPYRAMAVAPDHAFMGLSRGALDIFFHCLESNVLRKQVTC